MSTSAGSVSAHHQRSSLNRHQRNHDQSSRQAEEDSELDLNGQDRMDVGNDDRESGNEGRGSKDGIEGRGGRGRDRDIGLGLSNRFDSDDLPSPYLRTQFPSLPHRSNHAANRENPVPTPRLTSHSPIKPARGASPAHSIPPASPLQAHIALAAAAPPPKPRYTQSSAATTHPIAPYNAYTPGQGTHAVQEPDIRAASSRTHRQEQGEREVLPTKKALGNLWNRDIPQELAVGEAGPGPEDVEMGEEKEEVEVDDLESEADKGDIREDRVMTPVSAAVPKPRSARAGRNRKPAKNASGKKEKERIKAKEVEEDKENVDVKAGEKEGKGEFAYGYVAISQVSDLCTGSGSTSRKIVLISCSGKKGGRICKSSA